MQELTPQVSSQIQEIVDRSGAEFGVSIRHLESGSEININADSFFPMASVLKIPVLCTAMAQIDDGRFALTDRWELAYSEKNIGSGVLTYLRDGLQPTVYDVLLLMIVISDNTATDMAMNRVGVKAIDDHMKQLGLADIHLPTNIRGIFERLGSEELADPAWLLNDLTTPKPKYEPLPESSAYSSGTDNNVSTPRDMTRLLAMIYGGEISSRNACDEMLHILLQQQLNQRLPRFIPDTLPFAHKTGTLSGIRNDAGILYVNDNCHLAITAFCRWDAQAVADDLVAMHQRGHELDSTFGYITKAVYDHFTG